MVESVSDLTIPYEALAARLQAVHDRPTLYQTVVNAPFDHTVEMALLFLSFITFFVVDEAQQMISLVASSDTEGYQLSIQGYNFDPKAYRIALTDPKSTIVRAISSGTSQTTDDWSSLSRPQASDDTVRLNQATSGVSYSVVHPLPGKTRGAIMYNFIQYQGSIGPEQDAFMTRYTALVGEALAQFA